jgi:hypothetical protein
MSSALTPVTASLWGMEYSVHSECAFWLQLPNQHPLSRPVCCWSCSRLAAKAALLPRSSLVDAHDDDDAPAGLPPAITREVQSVFPDVDLANMLIVPTCQQADYDLVRTGEKIDTEKDRLLERVSSRCDPRLQQQQQQATATAAGRVWVLAQHWMQQPPPCWNLLQPQATL